MSLLHPRPLPLVISLLATYAVSAIYASYHSDSDKGTKAAAVNSSLGCLYNSFDCAIKRNGKFFSNLLSFAYLTTGLLAFCKWNETGSKIAFLFGVVTLITQTRWAYKAATIVWTKPSDTETTEVEDTGQPITYPTLPSAAPTDTRTSKEVVKGVNSNSVYLSGDTAATSSSAAAPKPSAPPASNYADFLNTNADSIPVGR